MCNSFSFVGVERSPPVSLKSLTRRLLKIIRGERVPFDVNSTLFKDSGVVFGVYQELPGKLLSLPAKLDHLQ